MLSVCRGNLGVPSLPSDVKRSNQRCRNGILEVSMLRFLFGGFFGAVFGGVLGFLFGGFFGVITGGFLGFIVGGLLDWFNSSERIG